MVLPKVTICLIFADLIEIQPRRKVGNYEINTCRESNPSHNGRRRVLLPLRPTKSDETLREAVLGHMLRVLLKEINKGVT